MRNQPRDDNNPANPLYKVAALDIKRANERAQKRRSCDVLATLNFKKSNDMRGSTEDRQGNEVTVNFSLAIRKANLEVKFIFEANPQNTRLAISNVAFVDSLATNRRMKITTGLDTTDQSEASGKLSGSLDASNARVGVKANAGIAAKLSSSQKADEKWKSSTDYKMTGIAGTYAGNTINWSIDSLWTRREEGPNDDARHLSGEVFRNPIGGQPLRTCRVSWNQAATSSSLEIHGSVRVMAEDLIVSDVKFFDSDGSSLTWNALRQLSTERTVAKITDYLALDSEELRLRLLRQIIKKHLVSQGMELDGASLEICSARG